MTVCSWNFGIVALSKHFFSFVLCLLFSIAGTESCNETGAVRLVDGEYESEGRLEICFNGEWGSVCNNNYWFWLRFDHQAVVVVCRQLGYSGNGQLGTWSLSIQCSYSTRTIVSGVTGNVFFGEADGGAGVRMLLALVNCDGTESNLLECPRHRSYTGSGASCHHEAVGIMCEHKQGRVLLILLLHTCLLATTCIVVYLWLFD